MQQGKADAASYTTAPRLQDAKSAVEGRRKAQSRPHRQPGFPVPCLMAIGISFLWRCGAGPIDSDPIYCEALSGDGYTPRVGSMAWLSVDVTLLCPSPP